MENHTVMQLDNRRQAAIMECTDDCACGLITFVETKGIGYRDLVTDEYFIKCPDSACGFQTGKHRSVCECMIEWNQLQRNRHPTPDSINS